MNARCGPMHAHTINQNAVICRWRAECFLAKTETERGKTIAEEIFAGLRNACNALLQLCRINATAHYSLKSNRQSPLHRERAKRTRRVLSTRQQNRNNNSGSQSKPHGCYSVYEPVNMDCECHMKGQNRQRPMAWQNNTQAPPAAKTRWAFLFGSHRR